MSQDAVIGRADNGSAVGERSDGGRSGRDRAVPVGGLIVAGSILGVVGDVMLRVPGPPALNLFLWVASVGLAALVLSGRAGVSPDRERVAWLAIGVLLAVGLVWRDSPPLKLLALGCATLTFALAAYRPGAAWVRRAGVVRYARAWGTGALHAWTAAGVHLVEAARSRQPEVEGPGRWRQAAAVARGLLIAAPFVVVFGALFMSADAMFADMVLNLVRLDFELIGSHVVLFGLSAWVATGYLRGFLTGTELPPLRVLWPDGDLPALVERRPGLSITEIATAMAVLDLLFLVFVSVQFRYLFGGDALVQITPDLTYAEYARRGFFELVFAGFLVVPVLLGADWLLERRTRRDDLVFRSLAGLQIGLVLAITASAFQRLRLYHASYGLTDARFYAMVLLIWIAAMLLWLAATVLRGRRNSFAFGALTSGLAVVALLFVLNPDAIIAGTNVARMTQADEPAQFDVAYATSLSADAVPALIDGLPALPPEAQCQLARHMLRRWPPDRERSIRNWNWSASRAHRAVRENETRLRSLTEPDRDCEAPGTR